MFRKLALMILVALVAVFVLIQFKVAPLTNPPSKGELSAPPEVEAILKRSCFDCHSNQTNWPWYSHVAPISWMVVRHVESGRKQMNFSEWGEYFPTTRKRKLQWMQRALHDEVMPLWSYRMMHPDARLSDDDRARLLEWIQTGLSAPVSGTSAK